ncbi:MAG TPA: tRNA pseudouridine(38-40) synthase TruA [Thermoanaerobaculia bacterium]|jgi:tRNA pseudouridine38-40 synthase|nr:tRNA pseudouridine(38-40) synthase TruA [Thermoanaerobaculia bacterium]
MTRPARYRALIAYTGTAFHGWQVQTNAPRTVQGVLQAALSDLVRAPVKVEGASRTDTGVHADGQVAHFDLPRARDPRCVRDAVNDRLPLDVRVLAVDEATPDFHARFDAKWKEYLYRWSRSEVAPPREFPFVAPISPVARAELMREAAAALPGQRDFGVFAVQRTGEGSEVRRLDLVEISEAGPELRALFRGNGFLRGMVRSICGVLADAARGRVPPGRTAELLARGDRTRLSFKAPAKGLTLTRVSYE